MSALREIVVVRIGSKDGAEHYGTGTIVAPNRVLTAAHVCHDKNDLQRPRRDVYVFYGDVWRGPAQVSVSEAERDLDVAVLDVTLPGSEACARATFDRSSREGKYVVPGYPNPNGVPEPILKTPAGELKIYQSVPTFTVQALYDKWGGISGAPLLRDEARTCVSGIVTGDVAGSEHGELAVVLASQILDDPALRKALGILEPEALDEHIEHVKGLVCAELERLNGLLPTFSAQVATALGVGASSPSSAGALASALVAKTAPSLLQAFLRVDSELAGRLTARGQPADIVEARQGLRGLACLLLPIDPDLHSEIRQVGEHLSRLGYSRVLVRFEITARRIAAGVDRVPLDLGEHSGGQPSAPWVGLDWPETVGAIIPDAVGNRAVEALGCSLREALAKDLAPFVRHDWPLTNADVRAALEGRRAAEPHGTKVPWVGLGIPPIDGADIEALIELLAKKLLGAFPDIRLMLREGQGSAEMAALVALAGLFERDLKAPQAK